ncbi:MULTISPECIES: hypothetical protein [unclassified Aeromicrobium]|uniref:hypothetical protein n=1 Tax=unclassified Aeromicrobium TaxID=2633570 RepID=UPI00396B3008
MSDVLIRDIAPRLTFQAQPGTTNQKIELVNRLVATGIKAVEVSSFVRADRVPGLADAEEVFSAIDRPAGVSFECCVGNVSGVERAIGSRVNRAWFLLSADESFASNNIGRSIDESYRTLANAAEAANGTSTEVGTYLIAAWGGPTGLARRPSDLEPMWRRLVDIGVTQWILADSCGYASPRQARETVEAALQHVPAESITIQVHDARGMGLAVIAELLDLGIRNFDTSLTGAGGHPAMPGARVGGVCTEDAVQMIELLGYETGIDVPALIGHADWFADVLGSGAYGFVRHAGAVPQHEGESDPLFSGFRWASGS